MKKTLALALSLIMLLSLVPSFAAGKLSVTQENFHVIDSYSLYGYAYAKVENVGDKAVEVNAGLLEIYNKDGDPLTSTDYLTSFAEYLEPGEYTYVYMYDDIEDAAASDVDDYLLTVTGKSSSDYATLRLPCETSYAEDVEEGYWTYDYMYATVTNNTDEPIYGLYIVLVLLDAEDNILYIDYDSMYDSKALNPGSSITVREYVESSFVEYFEANGLVPAKVDAIAYVNIDK